MGTVVIKEKRKKPGHLFLVCKAVRVKGSPLNREQTKQKAREEIEQVKP